MQVRRQKYSGRGKRGEDEGGGDGPGSRERTSFAIRKSGIRSRNIEEWVDIPSGIKSARTRGSGEKDQRGQIFENEEDEKVEGGLEESRECNSRQSESERKGEMGEETATFSFR